MDMLALQVVCDLLDISLLLYRRAPERAEARRQLILLLVQATFGKVEANFAERYWFLTHFQF